MGAVLATRLGVSCAAQRTFEVLERNPPSCRADLARGLVAIDIRNGNAYGRAKANFGALKPGMTQAETKRLLGTATQAWPSGTAEDMGPYEHWCYYRQRFLGYPKGTFPFWGLRDPLDRSPFAPHHDDFVVRFDENSRVLQTRLPEGKFLPPVE
jgi:hypothetical protein